MAPPWGGTDGAEFQASSVWFIVIWPLLVQVLFSNPSCWPSFCSRVLD